MAGRRIAYPCLPWPTLGRRRPPGGFDVKERDGESSVVGRILRAELVMSVAVSAMALTHGTEAAYSAFLGGLACLIPDAYFALRVFGRSGVRAPERMAGLMLRAEIAKLVLSVCLLGFIFVFIKNLNVLALVLGYALVRTAGVVAMVRGSDAERVGASGSQAHG